MRALLPPLAALLVQAASPQDTPPANGPAPVDPGWHALVHARVVVEPGRVLDDATIVVRDGRIVFVETGGEVPEGARVRDCTGLTVHAAFVDAHVPIDAPRPDPAAPSSHWHADVVPQRSALDGDGLSNELANELRALGFATAGVAPNDGIFRGRCAVVTLEEVTEGDRRRVLRERTFQEIAFDRASDGYPRSLMGSVALVRQTLFDADWHHATRGVDREPEGFDAEKRRRGESAFDALATERSVLFATRDELDALRAVRVLDEAQRLDGAVLLGSGTEFRRIAPIAAAGLPIVVPLAFPKAPDVATLRARDQVTLRELLTWEQAPTNPARLVRAGVRIALTTDRLDEREDFFDNLRRAIGHGLSEAEAWRALTTTPAELLGVAGRVGTVEPGKLANLCVVAGDPLGEDRELREVWVFGRRHVVERPPQVELDGTWTATLSLGDVAVERLRFSGKGLTVFAGDAEAKVRKVHRAERQVDFALDAGELGGSGVFTFNALVQGDRMHGLGVAPGGRRFAWTARRGAEEAPPDGATEAAAGADGEQPGDAGAPAETALLDVELPTPLGAFGRTAMPAQPTVAVHGATIWTSGPAGILENATLVASGGRIVYVGPREGAPDISADVVLDGQGRHVTPGLIDCHSHTGITGGVNEGSQAVTAEVRIGDVLDPDDIGWYRELAGGVTTVNQLHGSANPIGGQNQVTKLRWGVPDPEAMQFEDAQPGIKFALGENVKRSRSSDNTRYPNTRMGVEALIRERFFAARAYASARAAHPPDAPPLRRDLELEALAEILSGDRLIHCHSYRQDEILMLCRVAEEFGFRIGTFQHGLECYKVAEAIKDVSLGASVFSDWWAYKYEVIDAIPENAAILHELGVTVSFNSDSNELARRMNVEAAKAVKYGGLSPAEALALVTIHPARQLMAEERIGSLEPGKDADFVVWSGDPLSAFSRCLETWIDGRRYWSFDEDLGAREQADVERARLIQEILDGDFETAVAAGDAGTLDNRPGECGCEQLEGMR